MLNNINLNNIYNNCIDQLEKIIVNKFKSWYNKVNR